MNNSSAKTNWLQLKHYNQCQKTLNLTANLDLCLSKARYTAKTHTRYCLCRRITVASLSHCAIERAILLLVLPKVFAAKFHHFTLFQFPERLVNKRRPANEGIFCTGRARTEMKCSVMDSTDQGLGITGLLFGPMPNLCLTVACRPRLVLEQDSVLLLSQTSSSKQY